MYKTPQITQAERWLSAPYEDVDTGLDIYTALADIRYRRELSDILRRQAAILMQRIDDRLRTIRRLSAKLYRSPTYIDGKRVRLPIVAYIPVTTYNEESGETTTIPPYIDLSSATTDKEKSHLLKSEADRLMNPKPTTEEYKESPSVPTSSAPSAPTSSAPSAPPSSPSSPRSRHYRKRVSRAS